MNFEFSNPIKVNELFRPILQEILKMENISIDELKLKLILNIKKIYERYESVQENNINLADQVLNKFDEAVNLLFFNDLIKKKDDLYFLSDKSKYHIQSLSPIKINGFSGNVEFILDFLP